MNIEQTSHLGVGAPVTLDWENMKTIIFICLLLFLFHACIRMRIFFSLLFHRECYQTVSRQLSIQYVPRKHKNYSFYFFLWWKWYDIVIINLRDESFELIHADRAERIIYFSAKKWNVVINMNSQYVPSFGTWNISNGLFLVVSTMDFITHIQKLYWQRRI